MVDGSVLDGLARLLEPRGAFADDLRGDRPAGGSGVRGPDHRDAMITPVG
jgi:hypothetical protein